MTHTMLPVIRVLLLAATFAFPSTLYSQFANPRTDWLYQGKIGISTHYASGNPDTLEDVAKQFQVDKVAEQTASAGASWFLLTIHHQQWNMLAPNAAYDQLLGATNRTSERDVPMELHKALSAKNIRMMLYVNMRMDPNSEAPDEVRIAMGGWPPNDKLIDSMAAVWKEFSLRYGTKVSGWWVDAAGLKAYRASPNRERWLKTIADALRAGNPNAIIAFNSGLQMERYSQSDYTAGEMVNLNYFPSGRWVGGAQWHALTYLGSLWVSGDTRFSNSDLIEYTTRVVSNGGTITFDVGTRGFILKNRNDKPIKTPHAGYIDPSQVDQLAMVIKAVKQGQKTLVH